MLSFRNKLLSAIICILIPLSLCACEEITNREMDDIMNNIETTINEASAAISAEDDSHEKSIRIISTSDLHGKMLAYDYSLDQPDTSGSLAQVSTAISEYRDDNTILVDVGDAIQDNVADLFNDEEIHPMVLGMNEIGYDICTAGNHEFNFGMDITRKYINTLDCDFLLGNVYDENNELLADSYTIIEKNGVRAAFIGMVTPNIVSWDKSNLKGYTVTDPAVETNRIIDEIESDVNAGKTKPVDIIVGVYHMMEDDEYGTNNSGFSSMAKSCPRLNLILGSHGHTLVNKTLSGNIQVTENLNSGKSIQIADITILTGSEESAGTIKSIRTTCVETADYEEDSRLVSLLSPYDSRAKEYVRAKIGVLEGEPLVRDAEIKGISPMLTEDTPMQSLIQKVMTYYADADIAISAPCTNEDNAFPGDLTMAGICRMYKYSNMLYSVSMNGAQLKKYLEWSASFYQQYKEGDLIIAFEDIPVYMYDSVSGVNYDIDISKPVGERIVNLSHPGGRIVEDTDEFTVAVNNYRYNTVISIPGIIYEENDIPKLLESDIRSDIGDIRFMIIDYVRNVMSGTITSECDNNWKLIGMDWDEELHDEAVSLINNGTLKLTKGAKSNPCIVKITESDLP